MSTNRPPSPPPFDSIAALVDHIARHLADNGCLLNFVGYVLILSFSSPLFIPWTILMLRGDLRERILTRENCKTFDNLDLRLLQKEDLTLLSGLAILRK